LVIGGAGEEGSTVAKKIVESAPPFKLGDYVRIRFGYPRARIVELRGPLGPDGAEIYRVRVGSKGNAKYIEVRGDQLELIPAES
jgi:hypothetical protein